MHELDIENSPRKKTYDWFKSFKNPTYGINVTMDVTKFVAYTKATNTSFFINSYFHNKNSFLFFNILYK